MARKPRIHFPGAVYHVILRGNCRQDIFLDDQDRYRFYFFLQAGTARFDHRIHAFCLMSNHLHLVIQVGDIPLSRIMQNLSLRYTRWINWRHARIGHLFQGRYKAVLVNADSYLLELIRYVHLNPVRAEMTRFPDDYAWTGHHAYIGKETLPWLTTDWALSMLSKSRKKAVQQYISFVQDGLEEKRKEAFHGEKARDSRICGDDDFAEVVSGCGAEVPEQIPLDAVLGVVSRAYGVSEEDLAFPGKDRALSRARGMAAWIVQDVPSLSLTELSRRTGRDISTLSSGISRLRARSMQEPGLLKEKEVIMAEIAQCKA